jgi:outer membrane beta-barrel protein
MQQRRAILILCFLLPLKTFAADEKSTTERPLDGVTIEAVETYRNPKTNQLDFGLGIWPLNPYFNAFSIDLTYNHYFNKALAWEVLHGSYMYSVDSGITSELADNYGVDPKNIERPGYFLSSNLKYTLAYGKFIFLNSNIRYFRSQVMAGPALAITNKRQSIGGDVGWVFETFVNDFFSWKFELRDTIATTGSTSNNLAISVGTGYAF